MRKDAFRIYQPQALPPRGSQLPLLRIMKQECFLLVFCSNRIELFRGHWDGRRTVACILGPERCPRCLSPDQPARTYGFVHVAEVQSKKPWCLMMTADGAHNLTETIADKPGLRGLVAYVSRERGMATRPLTFAPKDFLKPEQLTGSPRPCLPTVQRIWHFETQVDSATVAG